jgi:hypothetical protein
MTIGIFTGKFKPPHVGHYRSILKIADQNDSTQVFVSSKTEGGITGEMAVEILKLYFADRPDIDIHLAEVTPVKSAYDYIEDLGKSAGASELDVRVYALPEDMKRFGAVEKWAGQLASVERVETERPQFDETGGVSGTMMRSFVQNGDKSKFFRGLPNDADKDQVWQIVTNTEVSESPSWAIPAASFAQSNDPNIMPSTVNVQVGGLPSHWTTSQPYSRFDLKTNPLSDRYGRNPSQKKVKTFDEFCQEIEFDK